MNHDEPRTSCEEYGHNYDTDPENILIHRCTDCPDWYRDEN